MQGKYVEAEASLNDGLQEDPNNTDILVNLLVNSQFMGKPQEVNDLYDCKLQVSHLWIYTQLITGLIHWNLNWGSSSLQPRLKVWQRLLLLLLMYCIYLFPYVISILFIF